MPKTNYQVLIYDQTGKLVDVPQADILSLEISNGINGGSGAGGSDKIVFARPFNKIGSVSFLYQVLVWIWQSGTTRTTDPQWGGYMLDIDQAEMDASGQVTAFLYGDFKRLDAAIVTMPQFNPGINGNPAADARALLAMLLAVYQPPSFGVATIPATMFGAVSMQFDATKLGAAIDTITKTGRDTSGLFFTWVVKTTAALTRSVVIQSDQNPNVLGGITFKHLFRGSQIREYKIATTYRNIVNVLTVYGGKDANGVQAWGSFQDPASVGAPNNFGPWQDKISVPTLLSNAACQAYATTFFALHAYPQAASTFKILDPDPSIVGGTWVQINEVPTTASQAAVIKQVRVALVRYQITGERVVQTIETVAPEPYLDDAIYRMGMNVSASMVMQTKGLAINRQALFVRSGGYVTARASSPAKLAIAATQAVFPTGTNGTPQLVFAAALALTQLTDNSGGPNNGLTGDDNYTISLTSAGAYVITKGSTPQQTATSQNLVSGPVMGGIPFPSDVRTLHALPLMPTSAQVAGPQIGSGSAVLSYPNGTGRATIDVQVDVTLTTEATTISPWLVELELGAAAHGATNATINRVGVWNPTASAAYTGANAFLFSQIDGTRALDLYARYSDGILESTWLFLGTTVSGSFATTTLPAQPAGTTLAIAGFTVASYPGAGGGAVNAAIAFAATVTPPVGDPRAFAQWGAGGTYWAKINDTGTSDGDLSTLNYVPVGTFSGTAIPSVDLVGPLAAGHAYQLMLQLNDQQGNATVAGVCAILGLTVAQTIANTTMRDWTTAPTVNSSTWSRTASRGSNQTAAITAALGDFGPKPTSIDMIVVAVREHGATAPSFDIDVGWERWTVVGATITLTAFPIYAGLGNTVDIGFYYRSAAGTSTPITWPAGLSNIPDPNGDLVDIGDANKGIIHARGPVNYRLNINTDGSTNASTPNLAPNADFSVGGGTTAIVGALSGTVPKNYGGYNGGGDTLVAAADAAAGQPFGTACKLTFTNNPSTFKGLAVGNAADGAAAFVFKANTTYVLSYYAKASVASIVYGLAAQAGGTGAVTALTNFPTSYADTAWHRYAFKVTIGSADYTAGFLLNIVSNNGLSTNYWFDAVQIEEGSVVSVWSGSLHQAMDFGLPTNSTGSTGLNGQGNIVNSAGVTTLPSYTSTSTSVVISVPSYTFTYSDKSTVTTALVSGLSFPGLSASTTYHFNAFANKSTGSVTVTKYSTSALTPAQRAEAFVDGFIPISIDFTATTTASGSGSGGGGSGGGGCPATYQPMETRERGFVRADELRVGEHLRDPIDGFALGGNEIFALTVLPTTLYRIVTAVDSVDVNDTHAVLTAASDWRVVTDLAPGTRLGALPGESDPVVLDVMRLGEGAYVAITCAKNCYVAGHHFAHNITL